MFGIDGPTVNSDLGMVTAFFDGLFRAVMVVLAQRLQFAKPEQLLVAFVWSDVIADSSECVLSVFQTEHAEGMVFEMGFRPAFPSVSLIPTFVERGSNGEVVSRHRRISTDEFRHY